MNSLLNRKKKRKETANSHLSHPPGDGFIMLASCYHGGGANTTTDEERLLYSCFMTRGWLRQEENHYLNMGLDKVKTLPREIQDICGYALSEPFLGWVNSTTPRVVLDPSIQVSSILNLYLFIFVYQSMVWILTDWLQKTTTGK